MTKKIPEGYHSITPALTFKDTLKAIEFYKKALGAKVRHVMPGPNGKGVMHAELLIGNSVIMMGDESPQIHRQSAERLGATPIAFYYYVDDVDAAFKKALDAGATTQMPPQDMFWGDRMGSLKDPFGYYWSISTHIKDVTPEEMDKGAQIACNEMSKKK